MARNNLIITMWIIGLVMYVAIAEVYGNIPKQSWTPSYYVASVMRQQCIEDCKTHSPDPIVLTLCINRCESMHPHD
ncbi:hypothetical protein AAHE18_16G209000 [Arachis hypogaea]|nr:uncharacterized protein DS421_16g553880 [Arachis hypogaea]